ncbi:thioredoxin family protein [Maribellus sp. CM-23]|uniref:thioredoxin family protein n=1 Tax=Maribellus sp. CM-23 TaxID=2781026 RepID=UPI001F21CEB2|nr:thioredoxin family protein [Maribellus sp. CM-23]MCE4565155.1 thioredoxin family protein [Maribellus sp. CM-23]
MKTSLITVYILLGLQIILFGQESAIKFRELENLEDLKQEAAREDKNIFVYLHYKGCPHCVRMDKNVLNTTEVGEYYNNLFVSLSLDIHTDSLGVYFSSEYLPGGYPAYLYFDSNGNLKHKYQGYRTPKEFIQIAETAFNESNNFNYYHQKVSEGDLSSENLRKYFSFGYVPEKDSLINIYLANCSQDQLFSSETWLLLKENTTHYKSPFFNYILTHEDEFRRSVGAKEVDDFLISRWVFMVNQWSAWWANDVQRNKMKKKLRETKHPLCERVIHQVDMEVWIERASWRKDSKSKLKNFIKEAHEYHTYGYDDWKNYYKAAWIILANSEKVDKTEIDFGYTLAKTSVDLHKDFENLYIYAHYCKQMGHAHDAIASMNECLQYEKPKTNPKYIEKANKKIEEWKNAL